MERLYISKTKIMKLTVQKSSYNYFRWLKKMVVSIHVVWDMNKIEK